MDKDKIKGQGKDIAGRVERQVGEWTDREDLQAEGAGRQVEGKVQKGVGKIKEAGRDMADKLKRSVRDVQRDDLHDEHLKDGKKDAA